MFTFTSCLQSHNTAINSVIVMMDSRRIISADRDGNINVWLADSGIILQSIQGPHKCLSVTNNMKFAVSFLPLHNLICQRTLLRKIHSFIHSFRYARMATQI